VTIPHAGGLNLENRNLSQEVAMAEPTTLYVGPDGTAYRLDYVDPYGTGVYSVLTLGGYQSRAYELPEGAVEVWTPKKAGV
jgi:hypothetical protein